MSDQWDAYILVPPQDKILRGRISRVLFDVSVIHLIRFLLFGAHESFDPIPERLTGPADVVPLGLVVDEEVSLESL